MRYQRNDLILPLLFIFLLAAVGCSEPGEPDRRTGVLSIQVVDEQLTPLAEVTVTVSSGQLSKKTKAVTTGKGVCQFPSLPAGKDYVVTFEKNGFIPKSAGNVPVIHGKRTFIRQVLQVDPQVYPGRWRMIRTKPGPSKLTAKQKEKMKKLETISYLSGHKSAPKTQNVTTYHKKKAFNGLNLYCSGHAPEAILMDMKGKELHRWYYDIRRIWKRDYDPQASGHQHFRHVRLIENGDLLAIFEGHGLIKLDKDSNLIWGYPGIAHHDLFIMPDSTIYVLTRKAFLNPRYNKTEPILDDFITILSPGGEEIRRVSILKCLENSNYTHVLGKMKKKGDLLHTNTIEVLEGKLAHKSPAFKKGNVLVSILYLDLIAVVDMGKESVVWAMSGMWRRQHCPTVLDNGHMLIFDNLFADPPESRVLEFDPFTGNILWEYRGTSEMPFYTGDCGSCQRLPNGNTLITESNSGRAFEVTPGKTIVWEFFNPKRAGKNNELIATLYEVTRIGPDYKPDWLKTADRR